ncbi:MAG: MerR family transcriptional regulator [Actinomycetota bacterium]|nr:MerR family transcriptional regulator [Actinomycetota bacterium]
MAELDPTLGVYGIATAAQLTGLNPQTLRLYEARGILVPARTAGGTRRYSSDDIRRLERVAGLLGDGLNLAGVGAVLDLQDRNDDLRAQNDTLREGPQVSRRSSSRGHSVRGVDLRHGDDPSAG